MIPTFHLPVNTAKIVKALNLFLLGSNWVLMAERAGFEPAVRFSVRTLSKRVPSTTQPPLHGASALRDKIYCLLRI